MASRPLKREYSQGYPNTSRQPLRWAAQADDEDENEAYDYDQRRHSGNAGELVAGVSYGLQSPVATSAYSSYGYPASANSHVPYAPNYVYGNQPHTSPYSQPYTSNEVHSPTACRSEYSAADYAAAYSSSHAITPAITYTPAPAPMSPTFTDYWVAPHHGHGNYGSTINHSPVGNAPANGLVRTPSQRSDGNRSQNSNDG
ncbi:hypothetical protein FKW77_007513 [Venturia effusa]|uniref:Uncharacterized protein n=1 Tax=Venturia effusa TaxID=50376 RepID=A0A517L5U4_9PEZI|nr:hypothetical protein FKW77_007513 [Venturia effusa]